MTQPPLPEPVGNGYVGCIVINQGSPSLQQSVKVQIDGTDVYTADQMLQYAKDYHAAMIRPPCETCTHKTDVYSIDCMDCCHFYASRFERRVRGEGA